MASLGKLHYVIEVGATARYVSPNEFRYMELIAARKKHESRLFYRLKKWFLGLRWVNNWLWRRGNKRLERKGAFVYRTRRFQSITQLHAYWRSEDDGCTECMPDYPSINELSTERPEE